MAAMPPPEDPRIAAAKIDAETKLKIAVMGQQEAAQSLENEQKIANAAHVLEGQRIHVESTISLHELEQQRQQARCKTTPARKRSAPIGQDKTC